MSDSFGTRDKLKCVGQFEKFHYRNYVTGAICAVREMPINHGTEERTEVPKRAARLGWWMRPGK